MQNWWEKDPLIEGRDPSGYYSIKGPPDPMKPLQRDKTTLDIKQGEAALQDVPLDRANKNLNIRQGEASIANQRFGQVKGLREEYSAHPMTKNFDIVMQKIATALNADDTPQGDNAILYAYATSNDPGSVVRESEQEMAKNTASRFEQLKKQYNMGIEGARLPGGVREGLLEQMRASMKTINSFYDKHREYYADLAKRNNSDPFDIVGPDSRAVFDRFEQDYIRAKGGTPKRAGVPIDGGPQSPALEKEVRFLDEKQPGKAETLRNTLYEAIRAGQVKSPKDADAIIAQFNQQAGSAFGGISDSKSLFNAIAAASKGKPFNIQMPRDWVVQEKVSQQDMGDGESFVGGFGDAASLGLLPRAGAAVQAMFGDDPGTFGERYNVNLDANREILDQLSQENPIMYGVGGLVGGMGLPTFGARSATGLARLGAGYGGAYGLNQGNSETGFGERAANAVEGAGAGAALGGLFGGATQALGAGSRAIGRRLAGDISPEQQALLRAGDEENIPLSIGDVFPGVRNTISTLETIPGSSGPIRRGIEGGANALEGRVADLARGGQARENMGEGILDAGGRYVERRGRQADRLYNVARQQSQGVDIAPQNVMQELSGLIRQEAAVPGGTRAGPILNRYAEAFSQGGSLTVDGARAMRSELLAALRNDGGLSKKAATRITGQIMGAVNRDIETALTRAGRPGAVQAYRFADRFYAETAEEIEQVVQKVVGTEERPRSAEQALQTLRNWANPKGGNAAGLTRMLSHLSVDERRDFSATIVETLGRRSAEEPFSPSQFVSNIRTMSPAARRIVFGADGERSVNNLIRIANAKNEGVQRLNNSRSGQVSNYRTVLSNLLVGLPGGGALVGAGASLNGATGAVGGVAIGGTILAASRALARALMNEDFTRAVAQAPRTINPQAINQHVGRLRQIGVRDPNVRQVVVSLEERLMDSANDNFVQRSAASPDAEEEERNQYRY